MSINVSNFYSVIIGTELLNGRRNDAHFAFINRELRKRGWEQKANFVIVDKPEFIEDIFALIKKDTNAVLFCFGGIGSTPDDYTQVCASNSFTNSKMQYHTPHDFTSFRQLLCKVQIKTQINIKSTMQ